MYSKNETIFGVGSLWFAYLVAQNMGYYVVATICIPIGIGHLKLRRWVLTLTQLTLWFWLGAGILLAGNLTALLPRVLGLELSRDVLLPRLIIVAALGFVALIVPPVPGLLSFSRYSLYEILLMMDLPAYETEFIDQLTLVHNFNLTSLVNVPLLAAQGLLIYSKRYL